MGSQRAKEGRLGEDKAARLIHTRRGLQGGSCPSAQAACEDPLLSHLTEAPGGPCLQTEGARGRCWIRPRT